MSRNHTLALAFLTVQGAPPLEQVLAAGQAGYDAVGLRLIAPLGLDLAHPILGNAALIADLKRAASDHGQRFLDGEVFTLRPDTAVASWEPVLEQAADFAMPFMQITSEDPDEARAADNLARVAEMAAPLGIDLTIEFMRWRAAATIEDAARLARTCGQGNVGVLLDALHLSRSGGSPAAVAALPQGLVRYLQICDAPLLHPADTAGCIAEARAGRLMPGEGSLWLRELMAVLPDDIPISVETPHKGDGTLTALQRAARGLEATRRFLSTL